MASLKNQKLAFPGLRGDFLAGEMDNYIEAVESGTIADVIPSIQRRFFKRFPMDLADDKEPSPEWLAQVDNNAAEPEICIPNEDSMTPEEYSTAMAKHSELMNRVAKKKEQIARRLAYMYKKRMAPGEKDTSANDLMALFLSKLGATNLKKPRQKIPFNVWAAQNKSVVDAEFAKRSIGVPAAQHAQLRSSVYKELFEALPDYEQQALIQEVAAQHALALGEYENALKMGPSTLPQDRQRAIECIPQLVEPILDLLAAHTGWKWSCVGGGPEPAKGGRLSMISVHSGLTSGAVKMNFGRSERKAFRTQIMPIFGEFMRKCWTVEECKARALPSGHTGTQVADICAGQKWLVAYAVDDDEDDSADDDEHIRHPGSSSSKTNEQIRARDKAREAAKKFRTPSAASTKMTSSLDVLVPSTARNTTSTPNLKIGPPVGTKRAGKDQSKLLRQRPEKGPTAGTVNAQIGCPKLPSIVPHPATPLALAAFGLNPSTKVSATSAPATSAPATPVPTAPRPFNAGTAATVPTPSTEERAPSPTISRPPSPTVSRPASPAVTHPASQAASPPLSPVVARLASPIVLRQGSPAISRPASPVVPRPASPVVSHQASPTVSRSASPVVSRPVSPILSRPASPVPSHPSTPIISRPPSHTVSPLSSTHRIPSGAVAVPDVSIPNVGSISQGVGSRKRKAAAADTDVGNKKRTRASTVASSSLPRNLAGNAWDVSIPADSPPWIEKAIKLLARDDFGSEWRQLVDDWVRYEKGLGFVTSGRLGSKGRPRAVADWIQRARSETFRPTVNVSKFETEYRSWWAGLHSMSGSSDAATAGEGNSWQGLGAIKGTNGLVSVLAALTFWRGGLPTDDTVGSASLKGWLDAVNDVQQVVKKLQ